MGCWTLKYRLSWRDLGSAVSIIKAYNDARSPSLLALDYHLHHSNPSETLKALTRLLIAFVNLSSSGIISITWCVMTRPRPCFHPPLLPRPVYPSPKL